MLKHLTRLGGPEGLNKRRRRRRLTAAQIDDLLTWLARDDMVDEIFTEQRTDTQSQGALIIAGKMAARLNYTPGLIRIIIKKEMGIEYSADHISRLMRKWGWPLNVPVWKCPAFRERGSPEILRRADQMAEIHDEFSAKAAEDAENSDE
jgi:transposase